MRAKEQVRRRAKVAKVLIVDDHPIVREGLAQLIDQEDDLTVCGEAEGTRDALEAAEAARPDIAIVDIFLREASGIELVKDLVVRFPGLGILVLSIHDESIYAERVLRAGARGYIMKQEATEEVVSAIRRVLAGGIYLSESMADRILGKVFKGKCLAGTSPIERLSDRELEVFYLVGRGQGTRDVAERLHLSMKTIETYREHIKEKLNLKNATELLQHAIQWVQGQQPP
jgi:DNA-binding NarL/FixJ family response regulator